MADIFISYAHEDFTQAAKLAEEFGLEGWQVWMDTGLVAGDDWRDTIREELDRAHVAVVLWTDHSITSRFVKSEVAHADKTGKLVPCLDCDPSDLPLGWDQVQSKDLTGWFKGTDPSGIESLKQVIGEKLGEVTIDPNDPYRNRKTIQAHIKEIERPDTKPERRKSLGDKLAVFKDPRPGLGLNFSGLPDIQWMRIPCGDFIYGAEGKEKLIELDDFYISKFQVTNLQFNEFVRHEGYSRDKYWKGLVRQGFQPPQWTEINRPRVSISWYDAIAFCRWLSEKYGYTIRLPREYEWEKAARGRRGLVYPWGNSYERGYANCDDARVFPDYSGLDEPVAVGLYPQGASDYGVMDLSGNAWEWCMNKFEFPEDVEVDKSGDYRSIRGGCWSRTPVMAAGNYRYGNLPEDRQIFCTGIRLVTTARGLGEGISNTFNSRNIPSVFCN